MSKQSGEQSDGRDGPRGSRSDGHVDNPGAADVSNAPRRSRRNFLTGLAAAGASALAASGTAGASSGPYAEYYDEYENVVDVAEEGADDTGNESITPVLKSLRADDTLFVFPEGRYYMDERFRFTTYENFGIVGDGATIVPANYHDFEDDRDRSLYTLFRLGTLGSPGGHLRFMGMRVDQTAPDTGVRAVEANVTDRLEVEDVRIDGYHDSGGPGPGMFNVTDPNGTGKVVDFRAEDGGEWADSTPHAGKTSARGPVGINANDTEGELMFRRCHLFGFPGSGLYAIGGSGRIVVHGGVFKNNTSAQIRLGGTNSVARWPTVVVDESNGRDVGQRGIRLENGDATVYGAAIRVHLPKPNCHPIAVMNSCSDSWIENTTIEVAGDATNHGIVVSPKAGETVVTFSDIVHEAAGGYPVWIRDSDKAERVLCNAVTIEGKAGTEGGFRDGIRCERPNCRVSGCVIDQPGRDGDERNAIVNMSDELTVYDTTLRAARYPILDIGSDATYLDVDAESYHEGRHAVRLYAESRNPSIRLSRIVNGIRDDGAEGVETVDNTTS